MQREEHIPKTYLLLTLGSYKILFQEDGLDSNFMDLFLIGIKIASITLLNHGKVDLENVKLLSKAKDQLPTYGYQSRLLPIGPPSDVTSLAEPPSTVGPSASVSETTIPREKVDFSISHFTGETTSDLSQRDMQIRDIPTTRIDCNP